MSTFLSQLIGSRRFDGRHLGSRDFNTLPLLTQVHAALSTRKVIFCAARQGMSCDTQLVTNASNCCRVLYLHTTQNHFSSILLEHPFRTPKITIEVIVRRMFFSSCLKPFLIIVHFLYLGIVIKKQLFQQKNSTAKEETKIFSLDNLHCSLIFMASQAKGLAAQHIISMPIVKQEICSTSSRPIQSETLPRQVNMLFA